MKIDPDAKPQLVESKYGPEPSVREILTAYYRQYFDVDKAIAYATAHIASAAHQADVSEKTGDASKIDSSSTISAATEAAAMSVVLDLVIRGDLIFGDQPDGGVRVTLYGTGGPNDANKPVRTSICMPGGWAGVLSRLKEQGGEREHDLKVRMIDPSSYVSGWFNSPGVDG